MLNFFHYVSIMFLSVSAFNISNTWYVSDYGSDDNDCHSVSVPCMNLQTILDRATDGADIHVTSDTLSLDGQTDGYSCTLMSNINYTISSHKNTFFEPKCCKSVYLLEFILILGNIIYAVCPFNLPIRTASKN